MNKSLLIILSILFALVHFSNAQTIPAYRLTDWSKAGYTDSLPQFTSVVNIMSQGGVGDGLTPNDTAFLNALATLNNMPGTIYFPAGSYLFTKTMNITRDSLIVKGDGLATKLLFDLGHSPADMISIDGVIDNTGWDVNGSLNRNDAAIKISSGSNIQAGDYILLYDDDVSTTFSAWAYGTTGQIFKVNSVTGNTLHVDNTVRRDYPANNKAKVKLITPVQHIGIECVYMERKDSTIDQTNNINFNKAANCWVSGVESNKTNFAHVSINYSSHILVRGNYFHHAHAYGGGGQGYGTVLEYTSGDCLVENNIFEHLRHSMLLQAGANGNVFAYNYSTDPNWTEPPFPANAAGDMVCHGNYPYLNLFEGNIGQSIVIDDSHGINGPYNTFFRNRAELYGIFTNTNPASDSVNYVSNEITSTNASLGFYLLNGIGHFEYGNNVKNVITPAGTNGAPANSLYLTAAFPGYWTWQNNFPSIGPPNPYNQGSNTAKDRYATVQKTDCTRNPKYNSVGTITNQLDVVVAPNPFNDMLQITIHKQEAGITYSLYNISGQQVRSGNILPASSSINCKGLPEGMYILELKNTQKETYRKKVLKVNQ